MLEAGNRGVVRIPGCCVHGFSLVTGNRAVTLLATVYDPGAPPAQHTTKRWKLYLACPFLYNRITELLRRAAFMQDKKNQYR